LKVNPKSQASNSKQYQSTKYQCSKRLGFSVSILGFVWSLDFGIWNLANGIATLRSQ
jgi:hypothetical protein